MAATIVVHSEQQPGRRRRKQGRGAVGSSSQLWLRGLVGFLILCALFAWQGAERRPTGTASGTALNRVAVEAATTPPKESPEKTTSLGGSDLPLVTPPTPVSERATIRIGTYNIHSGVGTDRQLDLARIAALLRDEDVVGLNEVRGGSWLSPVSQSEALSARLQLPWLFAPTENQWGRGHFGNGLLCRWPVSEWKRIPLTGTRSAGHRNAIIVTLAHADKPLTLLITHLDRETDRATQLKEITTLFLSLPQPAVLLGDLNTRRDDPLMEPLLSPREVDDPLAGGLTLDPKDRIDWILTRGLPCIAAGMVEPGASDHPHFWADFAWPGAPAEEVTQKIQPDG